MQPIIAMLYLLVCWYVSVDAVFEIGIWDTSMIAAFLVVLMVDIVLALNTVKLSGGKSLRTRYSINMDYLKKESYVDAGIILYVVTGEFELIQEFEVTIHLFMLMALAVKLNRKAELLKASFAFKKYIGLIHSVSLLLMTSHLYVQLQ